MTPAEIAQGNLDCATKVMGWKISYVHDAQKIILPNCWIGGSESVCYRRFKGASYQVWSPMTSPADCAMVKAKMRELGYTLTIIRFLDRTMASFSMYAEDKGRNTSTTEESAVTLAAIKAMEGTR